MLTNDPGYDVGATLRLVLLAEGLRRAEVTLLHALALVRGVEPDVSAEAAIALATREVDDLLDATQELGDRVEQLQMLAEQVRRGEVEVRLKTLQLEAEAALSAGVADVERVEVLARCLPMRAGFQALAAGLRCTDTYKSWEGATVGHLLASFRDADTHLVRHLTGLATLSPDTPGTSATASRSPACPSCSNATPPRTGSEGLARSRPRRPPASPRQVRLATRAAIRYSALPR